LNRVPAEIEIIVGDVSDVEAHIYARFRSDERTAEAERVELRGSLRGPFCDTSHTLPAEFAFRGSEAADVVQAEAVVPDPCLWSPELPHLYQVDVQALEGEHMIAEYHGTVGLRRLSPRRSVDFAPGTG
jgi:beta-galactosidase/beta-glucuronidase